MRPGLSACRNTCTSPWVTPQSYTATISERRGFVMSTIWSPLRYEPASAYWRPAIRANSMSVPKFGTSPLRASYGRFFTRPMFRLCWSWAVALAGINARTIAAISTPATRMSRAYPGRLGRNGPWVLERPHRRLDLRPAVLEERRDRELLAERLERLVDREAGRAGGDLEQHAARLAEVDRAEVVAVDHRSGAAPALLDAAAPGLVVLVLGRPGDVVHRSRALDAALGGRGVVQVEPAAARPAGLPGGARLGEAERIEQPAAPLGIGRVGAHGVEALEGVLGGHLGVLRRERLVLDVAHEQPRREALRI